VFATGIILENSDIATGHIRNSFKISGESISWSFNRNEYKYFVDALSYWTSTSILDLGTIEIPHHSF